MTCRLTAVGIALVALAAALSSSKQIQADELTDSFLTRGFTPISLVGRGNLQQYVLQEKAAKANISHFCERLQIYFKKYGWKEKPCGETAWRADYHSKGKHPLIFTEFGDGLETTLIFSGVHPDELTPVPMIFRFAEYLRQNKTVFSSKGIKIVLAPLVNPDGFLRNVATRTNGNGVDLNRNFLTLDWYDRSKQLWRKRGRLKPHFPGYFPNSEIETMFQIDLIDRYRPDKIISVHAPLGFLDYDGPGDRKRKLSPTEKRAKRLVHAVSEKSQNYRVVDYTFYPGSLGNFAGNERKIPTITLELATTDPKKVDEYWRQFLPGLVQSIHYPFRTENSLKSGISSLFLDRDRKDSPRG